MLREEILWVLRNARQHATDPAVRTASGFAQGGGRAEPVHRAQVGRWENGSVDVNHDLIRRYEQVLELPEGQLGCAIDHFSRLRTPVRPAPTIAPREAPDVEETLAFLERAVSPSRMRGIDWDRLSGNLGRMPHAMVRSGDWEHLIRRCILEMAVAVGLEYSLRAEAVARLAGHPRSGAVVADMAADVLGDPGAQFYNDTVSLLQYTTHPAAVHVLMDQLRAPTNDHALRASLIALTTHLRARQVSPRTATEAAGLAVAHLRDPERPYPVHRGAANLLRSLELPDSRRIAQALTAEDRRHVASIIMEGRAVGVETLRTAQRRIRAALEQQPGRAGVRDAVLDRLLETALGSTNEEDRGNALAILMISPQGSVVGRAYAAELRSAHAAGDLVAQLESLSVLSWLGQPDDLDLFTDIACSPSASSDLVMEAAIAAANCADPGSAARVAREERVHRRLADILSGGGDVASRAAPLRGLTYVLGMRSRFDLVEQLRRRLDDATPPVDPPVSEVARGVFDWWLGLPAHIRPLSA
jgi:hypothetical protein